MKLTNAIRGRRSCRYFEEAEIPEVAVNEMIDAARWVPSPANNQPWEFILVREEETMEGLKEIAGRTRKWLAEKSGWGWLNKYSADFIKDASALIVVLSDPEREGAGQFLNKEDHLNATACAIQNLLLRAHSLGYEGVWFSMYQEEDIKEMLGVPDRFRVPAIIPTGKPSSEIPLRKGGKSARSSIRKAIPKLYSASPSSVRATPLL